MNILTGKRTGFAGHPDIPSDTRTDQKMWRSFWYARAPNGLCVRIFEDGAHVIIKGVDAEGAYTGSGGSWLQQDRLDTFPDTEEGHALAEAFVKYKMGLGK